MELKDDPILARYNITPTVEADPNRLSRLLDQLRAELPERALLESIPVDPNACPLCGDFGYVPKDDGSGVHIPCRCQEERRKKANIERLWRDSKLPAKLRNATMEGMDLSHQDTREMVAAATAYIEKPKPPFLAFIGKNGNGKTRVAATMARTLIEHEVEVMFAYCPLFIEDLQKGQFTGEYEGKDYFDLMERARKAELLIIDDFGLYKETPWADVQMDKIVGYRFMEEKPTVITSNLRLKEIPVRLTSRLTDGELCNLIVVEADDYRKKKG